MSLEVGYCPVSRVRELMQFIDRDWYQGHVFGHDEALLRWQHRHRSDPSLLSVWIAEDDGGLVGMLGAIQCDYCHLGERVPSGWLALWFTRPNAKGAPGLRLIQRAMSGEDRVLGTARFVEAPRRVYEGMGFHVIDAIPRWVAAIDPPALGELLAAAPSAYPPGFVSALAPASAPSAARRVERWSSAAEKAWDAAWEAELAPRWQGACRDSSFLRWRYLEHPRWHYDVWVALDDEGAPRGVMATRLEPVRDREASVFRILDLVACEREAGDALAARAVSEARAAGSAFADFYCTSDAAAQHLSALGFVREDGLERALPALFQPLDFRDHPINAAFWTRGREDAAERYAHPDLYVTRVEGDQDRPN